MSLPTDKWFVEEFHLRSPVDEFQEFARLEMERVRASDPDVNEAPYRQAVNLVLGKLRRDGGGGKV